MGGEIGFQSLDLSHQRRRLGFILLGLGLTNLLGFIIARRLRRLKRRLGGAQVAVERQGLIDIGLSRVASAS